MSDFRTNIKWFRGFTDIRTLKICDKFSEDGLDYQDEEYSGYKLSEKKYLKLRVRDNK